MDQQLQLHRRSYVEEILIQLLTAKLQGEKNDDTTWEFLKSELLDLALRYGDDVESKFSKYVTKALEIVLKDYNDYTVPLLNLWNAKDKLVSALKESKSLMSKLKAKYIRTDEQEREILNIVHAVLISAAKAVLKDYKIIYDESV